MAAMLLAAVLAALVLPIQPSVLAQTTSATLTGTVFDASGAVVANATVTLKNEASGDLRATVSNGEGYFTFAAVPPGSYSVSVEKEGFRTWEAKSIAINSDDKRNLSGIKLTPGAKNETVVVEAADTLITPVESGEKSTLINEKILQNVAIVGQNAAEFVKIMPGMAFTGGVVNQSSYAASDERTGSGPVGNFSANGTRTAALDITSDGAHIIDPGCNCGQAMNTNADMTAELKVMTSNFGADESKGPVVISAIGKSGGQQYHGEAYLYARYYSLNANDPQNKDSNISRPETKYFYPGFQIGGPVILPHTGFNRGRDKMFFFFGTEYYKQDVDNGVYHAVVPTDAMRQGNFAALAANPPNGLGCPYYTLNNDQKDYTRHTENCYLSSLNGYAAAGFPGGPNFQTITLPTPGDPANPTKKYSTGVMIPGMADPNGQILANLYPLQNQDPSRAGAGGFNYANGQTRYSNMLQFRGRVDYNFTQSLKLYVSYNHQHDSALNSLDVLWGSGGNSWAAPTTPYPTPLVETTTSDVVTANLTKVINPTLTNELVFSYTYLNLPNSFKDPAKVERASLGLNYNLLFNHPNQQNLIFPQMTGWGDGISNMLNAGFELNGTVYAKKTLPSVADNLVKVWKTHTTKFGFYWERTWNEQPGNAAVNGTLIFSNWGSGSTGNAYSDMLIGQTTQYIEQNFDVVPAFRYITAEFYATDSWKISRRLTLDYGMRFSHLGPWSDTTGYGFAAWYPNLYSSGAGGSVNGFHFPGIEWHQVQGSTPLSGSASRLLFFNPRVGFAWDVFGTGKTVLRGGYGMYHFHDEQNVQNGAYGIVRGSFASPTLWSPKISALPATSAAAPSGITALDPNDSQEPRTQSYSFTIAQRLPWKSQLEVAYVGSKSDYLSNWNNNFDQINDLGPTSMFTATACSSTPLSESSGNTVCGWLPACDPTLTNGSGNSCDHPDSNHTSGYGNDQIQKARPLSYGTVKIIDHKMYSNYNSLQVTWNKQSGPLTFLTNYTFGKALGIRGEGGSATGDPTVLRNNYGTLPNNRTHIFNIAYVYEFPKVAKGNAFVKQFANGWQISGIGQYQTGADLQASVTSNFNYSAFIPAGTTFMGKTLAVPIQASASNVLGTSDLTLMPVLTCDPRSGLKAHQYINAACFSTTAMPGQQGAYIFPTLTGPGFFNTDVSVFKNFTFGPSETKKLQFRFSGYNFLNHPNRTFLNGDQNLNLTFNNAGTLTNPNFGYATNTIGHRIIQAMVRFAW
ncbi:MAG TPA: carboxypeptidase-like regulatory domain-containing protein [Candidatus Acidoferrum sp.]|nr:carboxypeptidase-like regulatory domain-containing protein [Candidatus Acidoferrum sp.]